MTSMIGRFLKVLAWVCVISLACARVSEAMQIQVIGDQMILSGAVIGDEPGMVEGALAKYPEIDTVILRNSTGGNIGAGYRVGEVIRTKGLRTAVSGYCFSSCSRMFLGGKTRFFTSDYAPGLTHVGFHGHYGSDGRLRPEEVQRYGLKAWIIQFSDGKADPDLVERWINLPRNTNMVHFYNPALAAQNGASTFLCQGHEPFAQCEPIHETALQLGIVTSLDLLRSNDFPK